jgi:hypothetical protein
MSVNHGLIFRQKSHRPAKKEWTKFWNGYIRFYEHVNDEIMNEGRVSMANL